MTRKIYFFSNPKLYLYIYYINIVAIFYRLWYRFFPRSSLSLEIPKDETQIYIDKKTEQFLKIYPKTEEERKKWNANIDERCYSFESFQKLIIEETNELEQEWKRRLLFETTPRGNVIMFYDMFKQAFAYVSDQHMNYSILNACAMKYVQTYRCIDFFLDGNILPEGITSPFVIIQEEEEKKEREKQTEKKKDLGINFKNAPFAKLKTYKIADLVSEKKRKDIKLENNSKPKPNNSFRNLGKISNLSILQKPIKPIFKNPHISCPIESFDYLAYKKSKEL